MEISSSAIGAMRVGVQIVSSHRTPLIEIYHQVHNRIGPETELTSQHPLDESKLHTIKYRDQNIFIQFSMINIGGQRAENIKLSISGDLKRDSPRENYGNVFNNIYPQMAPGQVHYLFQFMNYELLQYEYEGNTGTPKGIKNSSFTIVAEYDSGKGVINWLLSLPSKVMGKRRFKNEYTFYPYMAGDELPPVEYA